MQKFDLKIIVPKAKRVLLFFSILLVIFVLPYLAVLWTASDFNPNFLSIDSCLDSGGAWDEQNRQCIH